MNSSSRVSPFAGALAGLMWVIGGSSAPAAPAPLCEMKLSVDLTPDVPNAQDPGFLSSLANNPSYRLIWVRSTDMRVILKLVGPGPRYRCENEVKRIERDGRVLRVRVIS